MRPAPEAPEGSDLIPRIERHDLHGQGVSECEVYYLRGSGWGAITDVPCPVEGCRQTIVWHEAGYVPGYRVCMAPLPRKRYWRRWFRPFDPLSIRHHFQGDPGSARIDWEPSPDHPLRAPGAPRLIRDRCCEPEGGKP